MRRLGRLSVAACSALLMVACGTASSPNPAGPTPTPTPQPPSKATVASIAVSGAPAGGATTFQLTAAAKMSDGTTQDVTRSATWDSSNTQIATVSATGLVTIVATGAVDLRATYQSVSGSEHLTLSLGKFSISGIVTTPAPNPQPIEGVRVQIVVGDHTFTDVNGAYTLSGFPSGKAILEFSKDGYQTYENEVTFVDRNLQLNVTLNPVTTSGTGSVAVSRPK